MLFWSLKLTDLKVIILSNMYIYFLVSFYLYWYSIVIFFYEWISNLLSESFFWRLSKPYCTLLAYFFLMIYFISSLWLYITQLQLILHSSLAHTSPSKVKKNKFTHFYLINYKYNIAFFYLLTLSLWKVCYMLCVVN